MPIKPLLLAGVALVALPVVAFAPTTIAFAWPHPARRCIAVVNPRALLSVLL